MPATFFCPILDSRREPFFDLTSYAGDFALVLSISGGRIGAPIVGFLLIALLLSRPHVSRRRRFRETCVIVGFFVLFAGGGAWLNENALKPLIGIPRPNILWLSKPDGKGPLQMQPADFYAVGGKPERRIRLQTVLDQSPPPVPLAPAVKAHWIHEVGYSFPSGHAYASMFYATFFPALAAVFLSGRRRWIFLILPVWTVLVCWSRLVLRVHTPIDITTGGMEGISCGLIAFLCVKRFLPAPSSKHHSLAEH